MLKKIVLFLAIVYTISLTLASLMNLKNLPKVEVSFGDKIFHFLAYCILTILWFYTYLLSFKVKHKNALIYAVVFSIAFGILIEVLQKSLTDYRALDIYDIYANTLGALLALLALWIKKTLHVKNL